MRNNVLSIWNDERIDQLKALHAKGLSCSLMAAEIGCGTTRNAIIGKLHRLGLSNAASKTHADRWRDRPRAEKQITRKTARVIRANGNSDKMRLIECPETDLRAPRCVEVIPRGIVFGDLQPGDCRYPEGDRPVTFCGHPKLPDASYCHAHYALTHTRPRVLPKAVQEQRRRNLRSQYKLTLLEAAE